MHHCEHKYWDYNPKYKYRQCKYCLTMQYCYDGKWKPERKLTGFIAKWTPLDGSFETKLTIECCQIFEFQCYESWGEAFKVTIGDQVFGPFHNLNQADIALEKHYGAHDPWEVFDATKA